MTRIRILLAAAFTLAPAALGAQMCWLRVHPMPRCGSFIVSEVGFGVPLASREMSTLSRNQDRLPGRFIMTGGVMVNRDTAHAVGGAVSLQLSSAANPARVAEFRYRRWTRPLAYDFSGGVIQQPSDPSHAGMA